MKNPRKKEFEQEELRERLQKHLKQKALQPYLFASQSGIAPATVYRLLSRMNVSIKNQKKIEIGIQAGEIFDGIQLSKAVDFCEEFKTKPECCDHEFISREYASQPFGTCLTCGKTIMNLPAYGSTEL